MSIQQLKKEIKELKRMSSTEKPIEELLRTDPRTLTDYELFRCIQYYHPEIKTMEELTTELLEKMVNSD